MILNAYCAKCKTSVGLLGDKETKKAHCEICDSEIPCNQFLVQQLVQDKKLRGIKITSGSAHDLYCSKCRTKEVPVIKNNKMYCVKCGYDFASVNKVIYDLHLRRLKDKDKERLLDE